MVVWIGTLYTCKNYEGFYDNQIRLSLDNILKITQPKKKIGAGGGRGGGEEVTCIGFVRLLISSTATL